MLGVHVFFILRSTATRRHGVVCVTYLSMGCAPSSPFAATGNSAVTGVVSWLLNIEHAHGVLVTGHVHGVCLT